MNNVKSSSCVTVLEPELPLFGDGTQSFSTVDLSEVERLKRSGWNVVKVRPVMGDIYCYDLER